MSQPPKDLFKRFDTPPSPIHDAAQKWARHEGWTAPWDHKQQKSEAGKKSGLVRAARERLRRGIVLLLYANLDSEYRNQPFSIKSIEALHDEYLKVLHREKDNVLDATLDWVIAPFSAKSIEHLHDKYLKDLHRKKDNFPEAVLNLVVDGRKQKGGIREPWEEGRLRFIFRTWLDLHRLSETDLQILSRLSRETLKKDLKSLNVRGRHLTRRSG
jgi:hypothetical protein